MRARLKKWGNSLAVRVPSGPLTELDLSENSIVDLTSENGKLIVAPLKKRRWKYSLEELLEGIEEGNIHPLKQTGGV